MSRAALELLPNDFDYQGWVQICYAVRDAGLEYGDWAAWCRKWSGGNTDAAIRQAWNGCRNPQSITFRTLLKATDEYDPDWRSRYYEPVREERRRSYEAWEEEVLDDMRRTFQREEALSEAEISLTGAEEVEEEEPIFDDGPVEAGASGESRHAGFPGAHERSACGDLDEAEQDEPLLSAETVGLGASHLTYSAR